MAEFEKLVAEAVHGLPPEFREMLDNVVIAVNRDGEVFWGTERLPDNETLVERLKKVAVREPQPEVHIRGDGEVRYEGVGRVVVAAQRAGIYKVGFITEPPAGEAAR